MFVAHQVEPLDAASNRCARPGIDALKGGRRSGTATNVGPPEGDPARRAKFAEGELAGAPKD